MVTMVARGDHQPGWNSACTKIRYLKYAHTLQEGVCKECDPKPLATQKVR